ncbi:MAG: UPF0147 family protein [Candidatus Methanomethylicia archaeon]|nr:UPF0147 family protein [Candidatus Methanomethylicia archaeon]MCX8169102.1 UPF0147 family protein [Candidatus Methanomethylicia archaeon]MDW7988834.1 UPF0147 family protein [Nitrososphaerota archaeon]
MFQDKVQQAIALLQSIVDDTVVPRNIRGAASNAIKMLQTGKLSLGVRASNAISILEEISQDPNMPLHTRVKLWNIISILETIKD